ncbi:S24 family peptidase [Ralstonia nicotianae]
MTLAMQDVEIDIQGIVAFFKAKGVTITYEMVRRYTLGQAMPRQEKLRILAEAVRTSAELLMFGPTREPRAPAPSTPEAAPGPRPKHWKFQVRPITTYENLDELPPETTVLITHVDVALSAGDGRETWHVEEKEPLPFQADYIRRLNASPKNLVAVKVRGDSMEPRLFDDDTVVVDKADQRIPASGGVFALVYAGEMLVKNLFRMPDGSLRVVSDNKEKHEPFVVPPEQLEHINIVGRVKYRSGMGNF